MIANYAKGATNDIHLYRYHEIHRRQKRRHERQQRRHIMPRRTVEQPVHLHPDIGEPHDDQMRKHADIGEQARKRQRQKRINPPEECKRTQIRMRKVAVQKDDIPHKHDPISNRHRKQQR